MAEPAAGNVETFSSKETHIYATQRVHIDSPVQVIITVGGVTVDITPGGVAITGGMVTHNGINIGDTHKHKGVKAGGDVSGTPV